MAYIVEVDQSGKIGDTKVPTVLAFSNQESHSILIPATVKRACVRFLRAYYRHLQQLYMKLFAAALFLLLQKHLERISVIVIDTEYPGQEGIIKGMLLNYIRRVVPGFPKEQVIFRKIGKRSPAHKKAYTTYRGEIKENRTINSEELLRLFGK
jgi:hypothetical protein